MKSYLLLAVMLSAFRVSLSAFAQGPLTPPAAPAPTMKTLDQIDAKLEPRMPIIELPAVIDAPGSYYLTGNLVEILDQDGITISADDVTIDLNGFQLVSLVSFSHDGIHVTGTPRNLCIRNGTISGWGQAGISASNAQGSQFENLRIANNDSTGLSAGNCTIKNCTAISNTSYEFFVYGAVVKDCTATSNGGIGISGARSSLTACLANLNTGDGINVGDSTLSGCGASNNGAHGISASLSSVAAATPITTGPTG